MKKYSFGAILIANQIILNIMGVMVFLALKEMSSIYLCCIMNIALFLSLLFELEDLKEKIK